MATKKTGNTTTPRPKSQAEVNQQRIRSQSDTDALITVEWLNDEKGTVAYRRILAIREALEPLQPVFQALQSGRPISKREKENIQNLKQKLKRYTYIADIGESPVAAGFQMIPKDAAKVKRKSIICQVTDRLVAIGPASPELEIEGESISFLVTEASVVMTLGRLANRRELYKVRLCVQCGRCWKFSAREMDRFCSDKCRDDFRRSSPEFKVKNAERQKRYRDNMKDKTAQFK